MPSEAKTASKVSVNLASRSRSRNLNCLLGDPFPGWVGRHAEDVDPAGGNLQHQQDVQALEQHGLSMEEVAGQDSLGLGGQELLPGQAGATRRRVDAGSFAEQPHRTRRNLVSKPGRAPAFCESVSFVT